MNKLNILREAKQPKYVEIGNGFYVNKVGKDSNGNSCVWIQKGEGRAKKIQLVGNIPNKKDIIERKLEFFQDKNDPDTKKSVDALKEYYKKYLMKESSSKKAVEKDELGLNAPLTKETLDKVKKNMVSDIDKIIKDALKNKLSLKGWGQWGTDLEKAMGKYLGL